MKKKILQFFVIIIFVVCVVGIFNINARAYYDEEVESSVKKIINIAGLEINVSRGESYQYTDEDFGGYGIVEGTIEYSYDSYDITPKLTLRNFSYNFDVAYENNQELPSAFIYANTDISVEIYGECSFAHDELAKTGIVVNNGYLYLACFAMDASLNIKVQECPICVEGDIDIYNVAMDLASIGGYTEILAGGKSEMNELGQIDLLSFYKTYYGNYEADETKLTENSSINYNFNLSFSEGYIYFHHSDSYTREVVASGDIKIKCTSPLETLEVYSEKELDRSGGMRWKAGKSIVIDGNIDAGTFVTLTAEENITIQNGANVKAHNSIIQAGETFTVSNASIDTTIECNSHSMCRDYAGDNIVAKNIIIEKNSSVKSASVNKAIYATDSIYIEDSDVYVIGACLSTGTDDSRDMILISAPIVDIVNSKVEAIAVDKGYSAIGKATAILADRLTITENSYLIAKAETDGKYNYKDYLYAINVNEMIVTDKSVVDVSNNRGTAIYCSYELYVESSKIFAKIEGDSEGSPVIQADKIKGDYSALSGTNADTAVPGLDSSSLYVEIFSRNLINIKPIENGTVVISSNANASSGAACKGDVIKVVTFPDDGYAIDTIKVYNVNDINEKVELTGDKFVMPDFDVEIEITFKKLTNVTVQYGDTIEHLFIEPDQIPTPKTIGGQLFIGWFDDEECTIPHDFTNPLTDGTILYAKYDNISGTISDLMDIIAANKKELEELVNQKAEKEEVENAIEELRGLIDDIKEYMDVQDSNIKIEINKTITSAITTITKAYNKAIDDAKTELQTLIDSKADSQTIIESITKLQNAITTLEEIKNNYVDADAQLKAELEAIIEKAKEEAVEYSKGYIPYIGTNGNWWIGNKDTGVSATGDKGATGVGILKVEKTETSKNIDIYTITMTDGSTHTFTVTNGNVLTYIFPIIVSIIALLGNVVLIIFLFSKKKKETK